jgi:hypothetical protein
MPVSNFNHAPPSKMVDGMSAVSIYIETVEAQLTFDSASQRAFADGPVKYVVGPTQVNPIFYLRQNNITRAWQDDVPFPFPKLCHHRFRSDPNTDLRIIEAVQAAGSMHTLRV